MQRQAYSNDENTYLHCSEEGRYECNLHRHLRGDNETTDFLFNLSVVSTEIPKNQGKTAIPVQSGLESNKSINSTGKSGAQNKEVNHDGHFA